MKTIATTGFVLLVLAAGAAAPAHANWMGGFQLERGDRAWLGHGQQARVDFDFKVTNPDGARFVVNGLKDGVAVPGRVWGGSAIYPAGTEASHGNYISYTSGLADVDEYQVVMFDPVSSAVLLEMRLPVEYHFGPHAVNGIVVDHSSPSWLLNGDHVTIDFAYQTDEAGGVRISARPYTDGALSPGYGASGVGLSPVGTGTSSQSFTFGSVSADVDEIRFQMWNADLSTLLLEFFVPVDLHWGPHAFTNVTIDTPSPWCLAHEQRVTVEFDFATTDPAGVHVWAFAGREDQSQVLWQSYTASSGAAVSGHAVREFEMLPAAGEGGIAHVVLLMADATNTTNLMQVGIPVDYAYGPKAINNVVYHPAPPAVLDPGEFVQTSFDYVTDEPAGVRMYNTPWTYEAASTGYGINPSAVYAGSGSASGYFTVFGTGARKVTQVEFAQWDDTASILLYTCLVPADFTFDGPGGVADVPAAVPAAALGQNYPNPFNPVTTIPVQLGAPGHATLKVYDLRGRLVRTVADRTFPAGRVDVPFDGTGLASGTYFYALETGEGRRTRTMTLVK